jgi:4-alpha-glucanotransferase
MPSTGRISGILLPTFSLRSKTDFGIGDFGAFEGLFEWMRAARQRLLMVLPLLPTAAGDSSPYATASAFGLNPLFIHLDDVPEYAEAGGRASLGDEEKRQLDEARAAKQIRYDIVFSLKRKVLRRAFDRFYDGVWKTGGARADGLRRYLTEQRDWLDDYALFAALSNDQRHQPWWEWPEDVRARKPEALARERKRLEQDVLFEAWKQWVAETQWTKVRELASRYGILLCGDEPFIIGQDSADCWAHPDILRRDARLGVPPDAFSAEGQDWGLPYFDFQAMEKDDYAWLRFRARKAAAYYDLRRVDHAVGYFRQWIRDAQTPKGRFIPGEEPRQQQLGEKHFRLLSEGAGIVAEDLGVIPDFVRKTLSELSLPGYKVMRWEDDNGVFRNPHQFTKVSLVTTGTHDTDTLREWWETQPHHAREAMARAWPELQGMHITAEFTPELHRALLSAAENSGSDLCVLPWQDVLGTLDRVNLPGSMSESNWAYRIEQTQEELLQVEQTRKAAELLGQLTQAGRR